MGPGQWFATVEGSNPLRACGMILPFVNVQIWDEDGKPVPPGEIGEIIAKADGCLTSFWNNPEATKERIIDGWIKTGDVGRIDANGYLYLLDRADDKIISGGYNIFPSEIENVIARHEDVLEVAVFGVPHPKWGETPLAICVVRAGSSRLGRRNYRFGGGGIGQLQKADAGGDQDRASDTIRGWQNSPQEHECAVLGRP